MIEQINNIDTTLIHILAERCNDPYFDDFHKDVYEECLYRADRTIARKYHVLTRMVRIPSKIVIPPESESDDDYVANQKQVNIELSIPTFEQEYKVLVNEIPYLRGKKNALVSNASQSDSYTYYLYYGHNTWQFNYDPRGENDIITIFYMSGATLEKFDADTNKPIIPDKFEDERIKFALVNLANIGIAKFKLDKRQKYYNILSLNSGKAIDPNLVETKAFITIQPFKYP